MAPAEKTCLCIGSTDISRTRGIEVVEKSNSKSFGSKGNLTILVLLSDYVYLKERRANTQRPLVYSVAISSSRYMAEWGADNTGDNPVR